MIGLLLLSLAMPGAFDPGDKTYVDCTIEDGGLSYRGRWDNAGGVMTPNSYTWASYVARGSVTGLAAGLRAQSSPTAISLQKIAFYDPKTSAFQTRVEFRASFDADEGLRLSRPFKLTFFRGITAIYTATPRILAEGEVRFEHGFALPDNLDLTGAISVAIDSGDGRLLSLRFDAPTGDLKAYFLRTRPALAGKKMLAKNLPAGCEIVTPDTRSAIQRIIDDK